MTPETHLEYAQRIGSPRVVACDIDLDMGPRGDLFGSRGFVFVCRTHDYRYNWRGEMVGRGLNDRCPMSRLEEWRAKKWALTA